MRKFRIHNDIPVIWRIVDKQTLLPFELEGKTVRVALSSRFGVESIEEFSVTGNVISFVFKAAQQNNLGVYTATVSIIGEDGQTWTVDDCQMFELVARSCCVDTCGCGGVDSTSCVEFAQFIVVDQALNAESENPVANHAVTEGLEALPVMRGSGTGSMIQKAEEGQENTASGMCATALGHSNESTEHCSYSEGYDNKSGGWASHVEGVNNTAGPNAHFSHVGGAESVTEHEGAMVQGRGLRSGAKDQAVLGRFNAPDEKALFQVGAGTSDGERSNAFQVDQDGAVHMKNPVTGDNSTVQDMLLNGVLTLHYVIDSENENTDPDLGQYFLKDDPDYDNESVLNFLVSLPKHTSHIPLKVIVGSSLSDENGEYKYVAESLVSYMTGIVEDDGRIIDILEVHGILSSTPESGYLYSLETQINLGINVSRYRDIGVFGTIAYFHVIIKDEPAYSETLNLTAAYDDAMNLSIIADEGQNFEQIYQARTVKVVLSGVLSSNTYRPSVVINSNETYCQMLTPDGTVSFLLRVGTSSAFCSGITFSPNSNALYLESTFSSGKYTFGGTISKNDFYCLNTRTFDHIKLADGSILKVSDVYKEGDSFEGTYTLYIADTARMPSFNQDFRISGEVFISFNRGTFEVSGTLNCIPMSDFDTLYKNTAPMITFNGRDIDTYFSLDHPMISALDYNNHESALVVLMVRRKRKSVRFFNPDDNKNYHDYRTPAGFVEFHGAPFCVDSGNIYTNSNGWLAFPLNFSPMTIRELWEWVHNYSNRSNPAKRPSSLVYGFAVRMLNPKWTGSTEISPGQSTKLPDGSISAEPKYLYSKVLEFNVSGQSRFWLK